MKHEEIRKLVGNKFFTAKFVKKNGELRVLNGRLGVKKGVKGVGKKFNDVDYNLLTVYDLKKKSFRTIALDRLVEIKVKGKVITL